MGHIKKTDPRYQRLCKIVESYLDTSVRSPALETVTKDFYAQDRLADMLSLLLITTDCIAAHGVDFDKDHFRQSSKRELHEDIRTLEAFISGPPYLVKRVSEIFKSVDSKKYLFAYVRRELNWVVISILSASYISANILMRSIFELLIGIATTKDGMMGERIDSIVFLSPKERKKIHRLWSDLCSWSHPYNKWLQEACPVFISLKPMYHPRLCKQSLEHLQKIVDLLLVIAIGKFEVKKLTILEEVRHHKIDMSGLSLFQRRG